MVVQLDKLSSSTIQSQETQQAAPARLPKGMADVRSSIHFSKEQKSTISCWDSVRAFFASIWNWITSLCSGRKSSKEDQSASASKADKGADKGDAKTNNANQKASKSAQADKARSSAPVVESGFLKIAKIEGKNFIFDQLSENHFKKCAFELPVAVAVVAILDGKVVGCYGDTANHTKDSETIRKNVWESLGQTLEKQKLGPKSELIVHTLLVDKTKGAFNVFSWKNTLEITSESSASKLPSGNAEAREVSAGTVTKIVLAACNNEKDNTKVKRLAEFVGVLLNS